MDGESNVQFYSAFTLATSELGQTGLFYFQRLILVG